MIGDRWQGALGDRRFRLLFVGQAGSAAGTALVPVALAFAVLDAGGGPGALGLVLAASRLPLAVFTVLGGVVGDRLPRQAVMLSTKPSAKPAATAPHDHRRLGGLALRRRMDADQHDCRAEPRLGPSAHLGARGPAVAAPETAIA